MKKAQKPKKNVLTGQTSLFDIFQAKNLRMKRLLKKVTTSKMLLFSMTVLRRVLEIIAIAVIQEVVKVIAKTEKDLVRLNIRYS